MNFKVEELSEENFKPYGYFIDNQGQKPQERNDRFSFWGALEVFNMGPEISAGIVKGHRIKDFQVAAVEKHQKSHELLTGLENRAVILLGKKIKGQKLYSFNGFMLLRGQTIVLKPGIWHSPPISPVDTCKLLVLYNRGTGKKDVVEKKLESCYLQI